MKHHKHASRGIESLMSMGLLRNIAAIKPIIRFGDGEESVAHLAGKDTKISNVA